MSIRNNLKDFFQEMNTLLTSSEFIEQHRVNNSAFSRTRKLAFTDIIHFLLTLPQKSLSISLGEFFENMNLPFNKVSKQAFSKARQKIESNALKHLFSLTTDIDRFYNDIKTWRGYRILAIDGTLIQLPNTPENKDYFGSSLNQFGGVAQARSSALYDVLNDLIIDVLFENRGIGEKPQAEKLISSFIQTEGFKKHKNIIIFDRGYSSRKIYRLFEENEGYFVMRSGQKNGVLKVISQAPLGDHIIEYEWEKKVSKVRVVKFPLDTGEIETIATNIFSIDFTEDDFKELYFLRWGIETKYKEIKSTLKIENFTGDKPVCVEQDFYANMLISNICSVIKSETDEIIKEDLVEKNSKANYQTNRRLLIYRVARKIITLIESSKDWIYIYNDLIYEIQKCRSQIRRNRKYERQMTRNRRKYHKNSKPTL